MNNENFISKYFYNYEVFALYVLLFIYTDSLVCNVYKNLILRNVYYF